MFVLKLIFLEDIVDGRDICRQDKTKQEYGSHDMTRYGTTRRDKRQDKDEYKDEDEGENKVMNKYKTKQRKGNQKTTPE